MRFHVSQHLVRRTGVGLSRNQVLLLGQRVVLDMVRLKRRVWVDLSQKERLRLGMREMRTLRM